MIGRVNTTSSQRGASLADDSFERSHDLVLRGRAILMEKRPDHAQVLQREATIGRRVDVALIVCAVVMLRRLKSFTQFLHGADQCRIMEVR